MALIIANTLSLPLSLSVYPSLSLFSLSLSLFSILVSLLLSPLSPSFCKLTSKQLDTFLVYVLVRSVILLNISLIFSPLLSSPPLFSLSLMSLFISLTVL